MDLDLKIKKLIKSNHEGNYWDFKRQYPKNVDLVHDILCMSNSNHNGDRFLIIGVEDPTYGCNIIGCNEDSNRKNEANLNDLINKLSFAGGNVPEINIRTLIIEDKEIDVIIIKNSSKKPFYLEENYKNEVLKYHIYTRTGDRNTPKKEQAHFVAIEEMWKEHLGLKLNILEQLKLNLKDYNNWQNEFDNNMSAFYLPDPNFLIELSDFQETTYVEPFNTFYLDNSSLFGDVLFKYNFTEIFKCGYFYCDGGRVLVPEPSICIIKTTMDEKIGFYYYNLADIKGLFVKLLNKEEGKFKSRIIGFPYIVVQNEDMLKEFKSYLEENLDKLSEPEHFLNNKTYPNKYESNINLENLYVIPKLFDKWVMKYNK